MLEEELIESLAIDLSYLFGKKREGQKVIEKHC